MSSDSPDAPDGGRGGEVAASFINSMADRRLQGEPECNGQRVNVFCDQVCKIHLTIIGPPRCKVKTLCPRFGLDRRCRVGYKTDERRLQGVHKQQEGAGIDAFLDIRDVSKYFAVRGKTLDTEAPRVLRAVDRVSLSVRKGETLGMVGESGCGKSTLARMIVRLLRPSAGEILFEGRDVWSSGARKELPRRMQMIFQDPFSSLNPRQKVGNAIGEGLAIHNIPPGRKARRERVRELLANVGLGEEHADRYPHEFSGGQRQRIAIARALALNPELVVCDEAVSALDVSIQAQVLNLLVSLQQRLGLTYFFISHDLSVVSHMADRVAVMYLGRLVELADSDELYRSPLHPYTRALLAAVPVADPVAAKRRKARGLEGDVPAPMGTSVPESMCPFAPRCPEVMAVCRERDPQWIEAAPGHFAACFLHGGA